MESGAPALPEDVPTKGYVLGAQHAGFGLYLLCGTVAQLQAVDDLSSTLGLCTCSQLGLTVSAARRAEINAWKDEHFASLPDVPVDWTNERIVKYVYGSADENYKHSTLYIKDNEEVLE
jgi:hypothetical protein